MRIDVDARRVAGEIAVVAPVLAVDLLLWQGARVLRTGQVLPLWVVPVASVPVYALLVLRRRRPRAVFAAQWGYCVLALAVPFYVPFAGLLVALYAMSSRLGARRSVLALAACLVPFTADGYDAARGTSHGAFAGNLAVALLLLSAAAACAWSLGLVRHRTDRRARLAQELQAEFAAEAVRGERLRLARELHDIVAHAVTAMILQAAGARKLAATDAAQVEPALGVIESAGVQAMQELHRLLDLLRSDDPDDPDANPVLTIGLDDLPDLVEFSRAGGVDVDVDVLGPAVGLDRSVDLAAYRVIQESLTNASKHGGRTVSVRIRFHWSRNRLTITVRNTRGPAGTPVDAAPFSSGRGLIGLAERVRLVGGQLDAGPDGDAFQVRAEFPVSGVAG